MVRNESQGKGQKIRSKGLCQNDQNGQNCQNDQNDQQEFYIHVINYSFIYTNAFFYTLIRTIYAHIISALKVFFLNLYSQHKTIIFNNN